MNHAEFFAGMGLMRAGLERNGINTIFSNDIDRTKASLYRENWGDAELQICDIRELSGRDIPTTNLATASFPCVDLSVAGYRRGLKGEQSGLVFDFLRIIDEMGDRAPKLVMLENVPGFQTVNGGKDWRSVISRMQTLGYRVDYLSVNASAFVAQSRLRVFIIARRGAPFLLPAPPHPRDDLRLSDIAERSGEWWPPKRLGPFLISLSPLQSARVAEYQSRRKTGFFGAFRRTRRGSAVWEVRADEKAGALRTTRGGSARQAILCAGGGKVGARWMSTAEYARLQGAEDMHYRSVTQQQALFALGDGVCVPVIDWLARTCLRPLMTQ